MLEEAYTLGPSTGDDSLSWYLKVQIDFDDNGNRVDFSQTAYINDMLTKWRMQDANPRDTPAPPNTRMAKAKQPMTSEDREWLESRGLTNTRYRSVVGELSYLADRTRPDIAFAVNQLQRHLEDSRREQWVYAKWLLAYLKGTATLKLRFTKPKPEESVVGASDSDWAGDPDDRSSTSGYIFTYGGGAISWKSKKQKLPAKGNTPEEELIARSSAEAELIALDFATREALWIRKIESGLNIGNGGPTKIQEDNEAAIAISAKHRRTPRTKHIDTQFFAVSNDIQFKRIDVVPVASKDNLADAFTKSLDRVKFERFRSMMGLV